jgi:hypothetical protein
MGNAYSEERVDTEARTLILEQTANDLLMLQDVNYCNDLLRTVVELLNSLSFPPEFEFKGHIVQRTDPTLYFMARFYIKVAQCLGALMRGTNPRYLAGGLLPWQKYEGGGKLLDEEDLGYFMEDQYNVVTGTYAKGGLGRSDLNFENEGIHGALRKRAELFRLFSEMLTFPPNLEIRVENFRKSLAEFEPTEKWLDVYFEKLLFQLITRRIHSLQKI